MYQTMSTAILILCLALLAATARAQEKVLLTRKAKAGQVMRYKSEGTLKMDAGGMKITVEIKETEKVTVKDVSASGDITTEHETESTEMTVNGQKTPESDSSKNKETVTIHPDGTLAAYKSTSDDKEEVKLNVRLQ